MDGPETGVGLEGWEGSREALRDAGFLEVLEHMYRGGG